MSDGRSGAQIYEQLRGEMKLLREMTDAVASGKYSNALIGNAFKAHVLSYRNILNVIESAVSEKIAPESAHSAIAPSDSLASEDDAKANRRCKCEFSGGGVWAKKCTFHAALSAQMEERRIAFGPCKECVNPANCHALGYCRQHCSPPMNSLRQAVAQTFKSCDANGDWHEQRDQSSETKKTECSECPTGDCSDCPRKPAHHQWGPV